jgi:hypothetical protein
MIKHQARRAKTGRGTCAATKIVAFAFGAAALAALPVRAAAPVTLALFDFELEDTSAAASPAAVSDEAKELAQVTDDVRKLLAQSGRYHLVDLGTVDAAAAKAHTLRDCDGCEASIASGLGAAQSFVGVVRRVSRTEYTVRFQVRDAKTGMVLADRDSGLRMGADYSWNRGAMRLIKDWLESQN